MNWYAAHLVLYVRFKDDRQPHYPAWENIVLLEADDDDLALGKAERRGREDEGDDDGTFRWGGRPATWVFAGVRKLNRCGDLGPGVEDGVEVTFNELAFDTLADVERFVREEPVTARFPAAPSPEEEPASPAPSH